jgi:hypothetical protein
LPKREPIAILQRHRNTDSPPIDKRTIATAQIDQIKIASFHLLKQRVVSGDPAIGQDKVIVVASPDSPAVAPNK